MWREHAFSNGTMKIQLPMCRTKWNDDGPINPTSDKSTDDGLFRSLLRFRLDSGDEDLKSTLDGAASNATYTSKTTQNDIIECIQEAITTELSKQVTEAGIFSIMMDETTDAGKVEQASIVIRFVDITLSY